MDYGIYTHLNTKSVDWKLLRPLKNTFQKKYGSNVMLSKQGMLNFTTNMIF